VVELIRKTLEEKYQGEVRIPVLSEPSLRKVWDNPEDGAYDRL
jgi:hypothetical protein